MTGFKWNSDCFRWNVGTKVLLHLRERLFGWMTLDTTSGAKDQQVLYFPAVTLATVGLCAEQDLFLTQPFKWGGFRLMQSVTVQVSVTSHYHYEKEIQDIKRLCQRLTGLQLPAKISVISILVLYLVQIKTHWVMGRFWSQQKYSNYLWIIQINIMITNTLSCMEGALVS